VNIRLMKFLDRVVGRMVVLGLPATSAEVARELRSVLFIRPGGIGDAVLLTPAIHALKTTFPDVRITVLAEKRNGAVFTFCSAVDEILLYDRPGDLISSRSRTYDVVIDTEQWHRLSAVMARLVRARMRIGFATNERQRLFSHRIAYSHDRYERESFFDLLAPFAVEDVVGTGAPFLHVPASASQKADVLLGTLAVGGYVVLFPGASIAERRWGAANFRRLAEALQRRGASVVVVGGKVDERDGEEIARNGVGLQLAGKTSMQETAAIIAKSAVVISGDSGVMHVAIGLGRPTVSLFGPGIRSKWAPRGPGHIVLDRGFPCAPCTRFGTTPPCPVRARCIRDITVEEVFSAVETLMKDKDKDDLQKVSSWMKT
jgi:ADP-heptose:LPS heptosyltransferase